MRHVIWQINILKFTRNVWNTIISGLNIQVPIEGKKPQNSNRISTSIRKEWYGFLVFSVFSISCGETQVNLEQLDNPGSSSVSQLDTDEREEIVTNKLFEAVLNNKPHEEVNEIISNNGISVLSVNKRGDIPLGTAIQLRNKEMALFLLEKIHCGEASHQNKKGESVVYLSAKYGYEELIHQIANKCYENNMFDFSDYEFSTLDPETTNGEIAIHAALNGSVAAALYYEYNRGYFEYTWFNLYKANKNEETFLHTATKDSRTSTVEWTIRTYCHGSESENSDDWWEYIPAYVFNQIWNAYNGLQTYTWNIDQLINYQNIDGNTALHLAAQSLDEQNIRLLSSCQWMDFLVENKEGNIALQVFLEALDPLVRDHSQTIKDVFTFMVHRETYLKEWLSNISSIVDHQNNNNDSSLHISARLANPFFYNYLKQFADINLKGKDDQKAEDIFQATQAKTKSL